jgi:uroporphyrinogen III methyltransferase/synthase
VTVYLVGAGPGDPDLLTLRAARVLELAEVIVHDRLIARALLDLARPSARRIDAGKSTGHAVLSQETINQLLVDHGRAGTCVVRLKGGDPYVFGRGGEEAEALLAAGVPFEVVPGISSALAAPMAAGVPVTMRNRASAFTVVTGHEDPTGTCGVPWEAHAATGSTLVILMGVGHLAMIAKRLIVGGLEPSTPVVAVQWGCTERQSIVRTTLGEAGQAELAPPATVVVGQVAGLDLRSLPRPA